MKIDVNEHKDELTDMEMIELRDHIGHAYQLAEELSWCNPNMHFDVHKRTISRTGNNRPNEAIVPIISATFMKHDAAREAYTTLQDQATKLGLEVYDVRYDKNKKSIGVILEPFNIE